MVGMSSACVVTNINGLAVESNHAVHCSCRVLVIIRIFHRQSVGISFN